MIRLVLERASARARAAVERGGLAARGLDATRAALSGPHAYLQKWLRFGFAEQGFQLSRLVPHLALFTTQEGRYSGERHPPPRRDFQKE
jgi:hypothetical protein